MLNQTHTVPFHCTCFSTLPSQSTCTAPHSRGLPRSCDPDAPSLTVISLSSGCCVLSHQPMSLSTSDTVASIAELLDRVRACIGNVSPGTMVSLTIDVASGGERRVLCLAVQPDDCAAPSSADPLPPSLRNQPSEQSTAPNCVNAEQVLEDNEASSHNTEQQRVQDELVDVEMESETGDDRREEDQERGAVGAEEGALASTVRTSAESSDSSGGPLSSGTEDSATTSSSIPLPSTENIRRSARKQAAVNRLSYEAPRSRQVDRTSDTRKRKEVQIEAASAAAVDTTDSQSDSCDEDDGAWSSSASALSTTSPPSKHRKMYRHQLVAPHHSREEGEDDEEQVTALVKKFEEAYATRDDVCLERTSKDAVLSLGCDVMNGLSDVGSAVLLDNAGYQQCAIKLDNLIATSTAVRMLGYYLKGALAAKLKQTRRNKYSHAARTLLRLKSSADITACPAFYDFVQQHCPTIASGVVDVEAWLREPVFLADIGWSEWRRYLGKRHCWMVSSALERFHASLLPVQDWMQRGWVEEYNDDQLGKGVRATRDIPLPSARGRQRSFGDAVVADLTMFVPAQALVALDSQQQQHGQMQDDGDRSSASSSASSTAFPSASPPSASAYRFEWNRGKHMLNAENLWVGRINHLPEKHCNVRLSSNGKLVQVKLIKEGEALTFDYSMVYWVERVTGITWKQWMATGTVACRKGCAELFERMHRNVLDYTSLLSQQWSERFKRATSELEKELLVMDLWQELVPDEEQQMEEGDV